MLSVLYGCTLLILHQYVCRVQGNTELCRWPCKCPTVRPQCAPGVSAVLDGCGCCKSCARQIGELCNERDVCDPHKGMYCDFSRDKPQFQNGICAYLMAVGCDLNGVHYENGQSFQPNLLYKCVCIAGAIGCTPVFIQKPAGLLSPAGLQKSTPVGLQTTHLQDTIHRTMSAWKKNCLVQTMPWSPCSQSCDTGISVRISNDNRKCEMKKERRLCLLRPCNKKVLKNVKIPEGKTCKSTFQARKAENLTLSGCHSIKKFRPTFCGVCSDKRCCVPNKSRTMQIRFRCSQGTSVIWNLQWITSCVCQRNCNKPEDLFSELHLI